MYDIKDMRIYLHRMQKSVLDKMFFADKVFEPIEAVVDFGCANGELIKALHAFWDDCRYVGYDISEKMVEAARKNVPEAEFTCDWNALDVDFSKSLINISSTIHEVYSYGTREDVEIFWQRIFSSGFKYITIRDMMLSQSAFAPADEADVRKVRENLKYAAQLKEYEEIWGPIQTRHDLAHYLLKYTYTQNWDREVRENYFPVTIEEIRAMIPANYRINWQQHTPLPYIAWQVKRDFGIDLTEATHGKLVIERID